METTITLQDPFSYALWPIVMLFLFLFVSGIVFWTQTGWKKRKSKKDHMDKPLPKAKAAAQYVPSLTQVKQQYVKQLMELRKQYGNDAISDRVCYQNLSLLLRQFISAATGTDMTHMTLTEIRHMGMPKVERLIEEYYKPEFSTDAKCDPEGAMERTKKVIEEWN